MCPGQGTGWRPILSQTLRGRAPHARPDPRRRRDPRAGADRAEEERRRGLRGDPEAARLRPGPGRPGRARPRPRRDALRPRAAPQPARRRCAATRCPSTRRRPRSRPRWRAPTTAGRPRGSRRRRQPAGPGEPPIGPPILPPQPPASPTAALGGRPLGDGALQPRDQGGHGQARLLRARPVRQDHQPPVDPRRTCPSRRRASSCRSPRRPTARSSSTSCPSSSAPSAGMRTRMQIYTVPGQVFYESTRRMVLKGCDAVVFVADSQAAMLDANAESLRSLRQNLLVNEIDPRSRRSSSTTSATCRRRCPSRCSTRGSTRATCPTSRRSRSRARASRRR